MVEMSVKAVSVNFSFAFTEDPPSLTLSQNEKNSRKNHPGSTLENITISEENQETSFKETESSLWERSAAPRGSARKPREDQKWVLRGHP